MFTLPRLSQRKASIGLGIALTALLLPNVVARAGSWSGPTYTFSGTDRDGNSWAWPINSGMYFNSSIPGYSNSGSASGTVKATFTWIPNPNNPSEPPTPLYVRETATADAVGGSGMASADDGLGDAAKITDTSDSTTSSCNAYSHGSHLVQAGTTSPVVLTHTLSATCLKGMTYSLSYQAAVDSRAVTIGSSLGQTYNKGADGKPALNKPGSDGTLQDDTRVPATFGPFGNGLSVTYTANPIGGWGSGSQYTWNLALDSKSSSGTFNPNSLSSTSDVYSGGSTVKDGAREHAFIRLTDSNPEATSATANYWITFHKPVSGWVKKTMTYHPLPVGGPTSPNNIGEWQPYGQYPNGNPAGTPPNSVSCALGTSVTDTISGTIGGSQTSTLSADDVSQAFQTNESMTFSTATSTSSTETFTAQCPAGYTTYVYYGVSSTDRAGTCDVWGTNGYQGVSPWSGHAATVDANKNLVISWATKNWTPNP